MGGTRCRLRCLPGRRPHGDADVQLRREPLGHPRGDRRSVPQLLPDDDPDAARSEMTTERRTTPTSEAFARLFESVHEGVYIGALDPVGSETFAANPYLKLMFGYASDTAVEDVRPFGLEQFVDAQARTAFLQRLERDRSVSDYLLRLRRADRAPIWIEVTAR